MRKAIILGVVCAAVLASVVGCKKKDQNQDAQYQQGGYPPGGGYGAQPGQPGYGAQPGQPGYGGQPGAPGTAPGTAPPGTAPPPGPGPAPQGGGQCQPLDPAMAGAATQVLNQLAAQNAVPGSKPVGSALTGNCQQGQTMETQVQIQPGKCYTVVGSGLPPVTEVNVKFVMVTPIPGSAMVIAQDQDTGAQAVLGKKPNCHKAMSPFPIPYKMVLEVAGGQGVAAAQLYEK